MKKIGILLLTLCLLAGLALTAYGAGGHVSDEDDLLTPSQEAQLEQRLAQVGQEHGVELVVLTIKSLDGSSARTYADDYFDNRGYGPDGVLLLISLEDRQWYVSTSGSCVDNVDHEDVGEAIEGKLRRGEYLEAFMAFADACNDQLTPNYVLGVIIALAVGLVAALIVTGVMKGQLKTVRPQSGAGDYVQEGSMNVTLSRDLYLYTTRTKRAKPKSNSSGSHVGSSGRRHGGGGGSF